MAKVNPVNDTGYDIDNMDTVWHRSNLSKSQLLIWIGQKRHPDAPLYNTVLIFRITGKVDPAAFQMAFQTLIIQGHCCAH